MYLPLFSVTIKTKQYLPSDYSILKIMSEAVHMLITKVNQHLNWNCKIEALQNLMSPNVSDYKSHSEGFTCYSTSDNKL